MSVGEHGLVDNIVSLAADEAVQAGRATVSTAHLLIALSRISEERETGNSGLIQELATEFQLLGIDPRTFRRRLRAILGRRDSASRANAIQPSAGLQAVLAAAQHEAAEAHEPLTPVKLFRCAFASLADDVSPVPGRGRGADDIPTEL